VGAADLASPRRGRWREWLLRLTAIGARPGDDRETRIQKSSLVAVSAAIAVAATVWVVPFFLLGYPLPAAMPFLYQVLTVANLAIFARSGDFRRFAIGQVVMWLVLPFAVQWTLGGFVGGSVVMVWAFLAAVAALLYFGPRAAIVIFAAFVTFVVVTATLEPLLRETFRPLPEPVRTVFFALNVTAVSFAAFALLLWVDRQRRAAQARSDALLRNVLPGQIADRLVEGEARIAERHPDVSVLFADIVDFTPFARRTPAERVVELLDQLFGQFDSLAEQHGLEKIKTIGDAYMVVAGVPFARADHAAAAIEMALGMQAALRRSAEATGLPVELRIGIASGPVIAGVIGRRRIIYDLWGDTVNTASRMESHGIPGRVQVTAETHEKVKDRYRFSRRDGVPVKGRGEMTTYLLEPVA
jgi:adenylate cyclase